MNCYNTGDIYSTNAFGPTAGGIAGYICWEDISNNNGPIENGVIENCYNIGSISSVASNPYSGSYANAGGIVGINDNGTTITNSYWNADVFWAGIGATRNVSTITNVVAKTSVEMKATTFLDLLNANRGTNSEWYVRSIVNEGYPIFGYQLVPVNQSGNKVTLSNISQATSITMYIPPEVQEAQTFKPIIAFYNNRVNIADYLNISFIKNEDTITLNMSSVTVPQGTTEVKMFLWNSLGNMQPLIPCYDLK